MVNFKVGNIKPSVVVIDELVPEVIISKAALTKMQLYVDNCKTEIGWLGTAFKNEESNSIIIEDVFLFEQDVHATTTEITPEGLGKFGEHLMTLDNGIDIWNNLKVWGHSHVNMAVNPSGQDNEQMITFANNGHDWFVRIIANKSGDIRIDLYDYTIGITFLNLKWFEEMSREEKTIIKKIEAMNAKLKEIQGSLTTQLKDPIIKEIEEKVNPKKTTFPQNWKGSGNTGRGNTSNYKNWLANSGYVWDRKLGHYVLDTDSPDYIGTKKDVHEKFDNSALQTIGYCDKWFDARAIIDTYGSFTHNEISIIWDTAKEFCKELNNFVANVREGK